MARAAATSSTCGCCRRWPTRSPTSTPGRRGRSGSRRRPCCRCWTTSAARWRRCRPGGWRSSTATAATPRCWPSPTASCALHHGLMTFLLHPSQPRDSGGAAQDDDELGMGVHAGRDETSWCCTCGPSWWTCRSRSGRSRRRWRATPTCASAATSPFGWAADDLSADRRHRRPDAGVGRAAAPRSGPACSPPRREALAEIAAFAFRPMSGARCSSAAPRSSGPASAVVEDGRRALRRTGAWSAVGAGLDRAAGRAGARRARLRGHPGAGQRPSPPAAERVPDAAGDARRADARVARRDERGLPRRRRRPGAVRRGGRGRARRGAAVRRHDGRRPPPDVAGGRRPRGHGAGGRRRGARRSARGWCSCAARRATTPDVAAASADALVARSLPPEGCCARRRARRACTATAARPSTRCARSRCGTGCRAARRPTSRSTSSSPPSATGAGRWSCWSEWGWLEPGVTIAHLCDVTDDEIARVAASRRDRHARARLRPADGLGPRAGGRAARRGRRRRPRHERRRLQRRGPPAGRRAAGAAGLAAERARR